MGIPAPQRAGTTPFAYRFFVDGPCCEDEIDDVISRQGTHADVESGLLREGFNALYGKTTNYKTQWASAVSNYGRDWDISIVTWAVRHYQFSFILSTDDDALICTQNLLFQLMQPPFQTAAPFVMGFPRWDQFDNCFILLSADVARFFAEHCKAKRRAIFPRQSWFLELAFDSLRSLVIHLFLSHYADYDLLRPTHTNGSHVNGATFGAAWSRKHGRWRGSIKERLDSNFTQRSAAPVCAWCGSVPPDHPCHLAPIVDHRPSSLAWTRFVRHDPDCAKVRVLVLTQSTAPAFL